MWVKRLTNINAPNATDVQGMFGECNNVLYIEGVNIPKTKLVPSVFINCKKLKTVGLLNMPSMTELTSTFRNCTSLLTLPMFDTTNCKNISNIFNGCINLKHIPLYNFSNVTNASWAFHNCKSLYILPDIDLMNCTNFSATFKYCSNLLKLCEKMNFEHVTTIDNMCNGCMNLQEFNHPLYVDSSGQNGASGYIDAFTNCESLQKLKFAYSKITNGSRMFGGNNGLKEMEIDYLEKAGSGKYPFEDGDLHMISVISGELQGLN